MTAFAAALAAFAAFAVGVAAGLVHFLTLRGITRMLATGRTVLPVALMPLRFLVLGAVLYFVARMGGAVPLIAAAAGILTARLLVVRRERADG